MNRFERKITLRVLGIHVAVIAFLLLQSLLHGCFRPKPKPEIVTFVEFGQPGPAVSIQEVSEMPEPTPDPAPEPDPLPVPKPKPLPLPDPVKSEPVAAPKPKLEPEPVSRPEPAPKPKWKAVDPDKIKQGPRVNDAPAPQPTLSQSDIREALSGVVESSSAVGNPNEVATYPGKVSNYFYPYWTPPASASAASDACEIRVTFRKDGVITGRKLMRSSGDAIYDQSAMAAVRAVSTVPRPPAGYAFDYVEIEFKIRN
jgi:TonB family protein